MCSDVEVPNTYNLNNRLNKEIGFNFKKTDSINTEDIKKYLNYMYRTSHDGTSKGYSTIAKHIGIPTETARGIKAFLQQKNVLQVIGNRTSIIKSLDEALSLCSSL